MKNETPIVINEEHLGGDATEAQARAMVRILEARGYDIAYGVPTGYGENANQIPDAEWMEVLNLACNTKAQTAPAQSGQHTPGPWTHGLAFDEKTIVVGPATKDSEGGSDIWMVSLLTKPDKINTPASIAEVEANASLIAAAPDLLAALERLQKQMRDGYADHKADWTELDSDAYEAASAALAKAKGGDK